MDRNILERYFTIDQRKCNDLAHKLFMETSGINREGKKFRRMQESAHRMRESIDENIQIRAAYVYYEDVRIRGNTADISGQQLSCSAFEQIEHGSVKGAYIYALTVGDFALPDENIMDQLYADIWGTSFADAARILLKEKLTEEVGMQKGAGLSDSFGPGFYGMKVSAMKQLSKLIDLQLLGIQLRNSSVMLPLKSCAGIYFSVNENYREINRSCQSCLGNHTSCQLCQINGGR